MILRIKVLGNAGVTPLKLSVTFLPACKAILFLSWIKKIRCQAHFHLEMTELQLKKLKYPYKRI